MDIAVLLKEDMECNGHGNRASYEKVGELAEHYGVTQKIVHKIKKKLVENIDCPMTDFTRQFNKRGRKKINRETLQQAVAALPSVKCQNYQSIDFSNTSIPHGYLAYDTGEELMCAFLLSLTGPL